MFPHRKKKKKNNNNNSKMSSQEKASIWIQLYVGETESGHSVKIRPIPENVYYLTEAVKVEVEPKLNHCAPSHLNVFAVGTQVPTPASTEPLRPGRKLSELDATTDEKPLIVVAPAPQQQDGDLHDMMVKYITEQMREAETIPLSNVKTKTYASVSSTLELKLEGGIWDTQPKGLASPPNFVWDWESAEADESNRSRYMSHLRELFTWPGHALVDCNEAGHNYKSLLDTTKFDGTHSTSGNIDVVVVADPDARNRTIKQNIKAGIELKKTGNEGDHEGQVILQHLAASWLNPRVGLLTLMTDLNERWHFYWFAAAGEENVLYRLIANGQEAAFLLEHMFDDPNTVDPALSFPEDFLKRGTWTSVFSHPTRLPTVP